MLTDALNELDRDQRSRAATALNSALQLGAIAPTFVITLVATNAVTKLGGGNLNEWTRKLADAGQPPFWKIDWITNCPAQDDVHPKVSDTIELLMTII